MSNKAEIFKNEDSRIEEAAFSAGYVPGTKEEAALVRRIDRRMLPMLWGKSSSSLLHLGQQALLLTWSRDPVYSDVHSQLPGSNQHRKRQRYASERAPSWLTPDSC